MPCLPPSRLRSPKAPPSGSRAFKAPYTSSPSVKRLLARRFLTCCSLRSLTAPRFASATTNLAAMNLRPAWFSRSPSAASTACGMCSRATVSATDFAPSPCPEFPARSAPGEIFADQRVFQRKHISLPASDSSLATNPRLFQFVSMHSLRASCASVLGIPPRPSNHFSMVDASCCFGWVASRKSNVGF